MVPSAETEKALARRPGALGPAPESETPAGQRESPIALPRNGRSTTPADVIRLQRSAGNQAVTSMLGGMQRSPETMVAEIGSAPAEGSPSELVGATSGTPGAAGASAGAPPGPPASPEEGGVGALVGGMQGLVDKSPATERGSADRTAGAPVEGTDGGPEEQQGEGGIGRLFASLREAKGDPQRQEPATGMGRLFASLRDAKGQPQRQEPAAGGPAAAGAAAGGMIAGPMGAMIGSALGTAGGAAVDMGMDVVGAEKPEPTVGGPAAAGAAAGGMIAGPMGAMIGSALGTAGAAAADMGSQVIGAAGGAVGGPAAATETAGGMFAGPMGTMIGGAFGTAGPAAPDIEGTARRPGSAGVTGGGGRPSAAGGAADGAAGAGGAGGGAVAAGGAAGGELAAGAGGGIGAVAGEAENAPEMPELGQLGASERRRDQIPGAPAAEQAEVSASPDPSASLLMPARMLRLQPAAGNAAVTQLVGAHRAAVQRAPVAAPEEVAVIAARVDRLELAVKLKPFPRPRLEIDREAVTSALADLTAAEGRAVAVEYKRRTKFPLRDVIWGQVDFDDGTIGNNLSAAERRSLALLLAGTKGEQAPDLAEVHATGEAVGAFVGGVASTLAPLVGKTVDPDDVASTAAAVAVVAVREKSAQAESVVERRRLSVQANQLKSWLDRGENEKVLALLRRVAKKQPELQALADEYARHFGDSLYNVLQSKLKDRDRERANALWGGAIVAADKLAIESDQEKLKKAEAEAKKYAPAMAFMSGAKQIKERERQARAAAEARVEALSQEPAVEAAEVPAEGAGGGEVPADGAAAVAPAPKSQLEAVLEAGGDSDEARAKLEKGLGLGADALKKGNRPELIASRLARADRDGSLKAEHLEAALVELRQAAQDDAQEQLLTEPALAQDPKAFITQKTDEYFARFRARFDADNPGRPLRKVMPSLGSTPERERNAALLLQRGEMPDWQALYFALRADPKDMDRVRQILGGKTPKQAEALAAEYREETKQYGKARDLETDLVGTAEQQRLVEGEWTPVSGEAREAQREKSVLLRGGQFEATASDEEGRLREEGAWLMGRIADMERRVMENKGTFAGVRDYLGNLEHTLVKRARTDATDAKSSLENALLEHPPNVEAAKAQIAAMRIIHGRLEHNLGVYKTATKEAFDEFVDMAVLVVSTIVTAGQAGPILMAIRTTAATIATKFTLKGGYDSVDEFLADIRDGAVSAVGGKLADVLVPRLAVAYARGATKLGTKVGLSQKAAQELTERVAAKLGPAARWEADYLVGELTTEAVTGEGSFGLGGHAMALEQHGATSVIRSRRAARKGRRKSEGKGDEALGKAAADAEAEAAARKAEAEAKPDAPKTAEAEPEAPVSQERPKGQDQPIVVGVPPAASPPSRPPTGPVDPVNGGLLPEGSAQALQQLADQYDLVVKVRPMNPESIARLQPRRDAAGAVIGKGAMAKVDIVKAKSITQVDGYIGAPADSRGLVGLFEPHLPSPDLPPDVQAAATERYEQRLKEWNSRDADYGQLIKDGIVRVEGGLLLVADPRQAGGPDDKFGKYRQVAGDIDVYDITHADGTPLTGDQRNEATLLLRSMGIAVEHGAHEWWAQQSQETYKQETYEKIRAEHLAKTPLVAFVPAESPQTAWADTQIKRPPREAKPGQRITPMRLGGREVKPLPATAEAETVPTAEDVPTGMPRDAGSVATAEAVATGQEARREAGEGGRPGRPGRAEGSDLPATPAGAAIGRGVVFDEKPRGQFRAVDKPSAGTTESVIVEDTYDKNKKYIFKPLGGEKPVPQAEERGVVAGHYAERAKAAELAAVALDVETPNVQLVVINGRKGSLTEWIAPKNADEPELMSLADHLRPREDTSDITATQRLHALQADPEFQRAWNDVQALDFLINNVDRVQNHGNYLIEFHPNGKFKSLRPIDSELSFTSTAERAVIKKKTTALEGITLSDPMIDRLIELGKRRNEFADQIRPLVGDKAVEGVLHRLDQLIAKALETRAKRTASQP